MTWPQLVEHRLLADDSLAVDRQLSDGTTGVEGRLLHILDAVLLIGSVVCSVTGRTFVDRIVGSILPYQALTNPARRGQRLRAAGGGHRQLAAGSSAVHRWEHRPGAYEAPDGTDP